MPTVKGVPISPYVRKVLVALDFKGVVYEIDLAKNPLGKVPVYHDECGFVPDSSVICQYLEDKFPKPPLYPSDPFEAARARWLEEYADTKLLEVTGPPLFHERTVKPRFLNQRTDEQRVVTNIENHLPPVLDYLNQEAPGDFFFEQNFMRDRHRHRYALSQCAACVLRDRPQTLAAARGLCDTGTRALDIC